MLNFVLLYCCYLFFQEVPEHRMPLFKLIELLETKFHTNVSVSDINKLKDISKITDSDNGRIISLIQELRSATPGLSKVCY